MVGFFKASNSFAFNQNKANEGVISNEIYGATFQTLQMLTQNLFCYNIIEAMI